MWDENGELTEKAAYELFWLIKGHFNTTHETIMSCKDGYFKRLWCMYDGQNPYEMYMDGFEEAYAEAIKRKENNC